MTQALLSSRQSDDEEEPKVMKEVQNGQVSTGLTENQHKGVPNRLILTAIGAAMGSLLIGYNLGVLNAPETLIKAFMNKTSYQRDGTEMSHETLRNLWALTVSIYSVGGCFGGVLAGWLVTKLGRKGACLANVPIGIVASALMFASKRAGSYEMIIIGRVISGFHGGLSGGISPLYLSEISIPKIRGAVGVFHQWATVTGTLISQIVGFPDLLGTADRWDFLLGFAVIPCLLQGLILSFCPESPRYLLINKRDEKGCRAAMVILRGTNEVEDDINEIKNEMSVCGEQMSFTQLFASKYLRMPLLIVIVVHLSQQFSGANGVYFYSTRMFTDAGISVENAKYTSSAVGGIQVVVAVIVVALIDRVGRRTLHCLGLAGMAIFTLLAPISLALKDQVNGMEICSIIFVLAYLAFFAVGPASVPWVLASELFSHDARPAAVSVCVVVNWLSNFVIAFLFPLMQDGLKGYTLLPFTVALVLFFLFSIFFVPETKGKTFEEVAVMWKKKEIDETEMSNSLLNKQADSFHGEKSAKYGSTNAAFIQSDNGDDDNKTVN